MTKIEILVEQVRNNQIAVLNDGTLKQLKEVLEMCFPDDESGIDGQHKFYTARGVYWYVQHNCLIPAVSLKEFFKDEESEELIEYKNLLDKQQEEIEMLKHENEQLHNQSGTFISLQYVEEKIKYWEEERNKYYSKGMGYYSECSLIEKAILDFKELAAQSSLIDKTKLDSELEEFLKWRQMQTLTGMCIGLSFSEIVQMYLSYSGKTQNEMIIKH